MKLQRKYVKNEREIYDITIGKPEVLLIFDMCRHTIKNTPKTLDTHPMHARLRNIMRCLEDEYRDIRTKNHDRRKQEELK